MLDGLLAKSVGRNQRFYCRLALFFGANPDAIDRGSGYCALHIASALGTEGMVDLLLSNGADVAQLDSSHCTALHRSVYNGRSSITDKLLAREELPIDVKSTSGLTALHIACLRGDFDSIEKLITKGAGVIIPDKNGRTPFHYAAMRFDREILRLFTECHIDVNIVDDNGFTALHFAIAGGNVGGLDYLLSLSGIDNTLRTTSIARVEDVYIPRGIGLMTEVTLLLRDSVLSQDVAIQLRKHLSALGLEEDDLKAIARAEADAIFAHQDSSASVFATERVMRFAGQTPQRRGFHDHFVNVFRNQMQLWHLVHAGLIPIQDKTASAESVLQTLVSSCPIPGLSALVAGITRVHEMHRLSDWDRVARQRFLMLSEPLVVARRVGAMIVNIYAPVIDAMSSERSKFSSEKEMVKCIMRLIPKDKFSVSEHFAIELNSFLIDHITARRLLDDISLPKQLFALVAENMRDLLRNFVEIEAGSDIDILVGSLARGFKGTATDADAVRRAYARLARTHTALSEFTESRADLLDLAPSHVQRLGLGDVGVSSAEFGSGDLEVTPL